MLAVCRGLRQTGSGSPSGKSCPGASKGAVSRGSGTCGVGAVPKSWGHPATSYRNIATSHQTCNIVSSNCNIVLNLPGCVGLPQCVKFVN